MKDKKEARPLSQSTFFIITVFFFLFMSKSSLSVNVRLQRHFSLFFFLPQRKALLKVFCDCLLGWPHLYLFVSVRPNIGFLSFQCGGVARELHTVQVQPEGLHGDQLRGLRPCGESL